MDTTTTDRLAVAVILLAAAAGIAALPQLPADIATHWNAAGQVDGTMPTLPGVLLIPVLAAGILGLFRAIPRIDPLKENIAAFRGTYEEFVFAMVVFLAYIQALVLWWNLGGTVNMSQAIIPAVAGLYVMVGRVMAAARQNWFIGIRTPWTLSSEAVWDAVHRQAAPLFTAAGAVALLGLVLPDHRMVLIAGPALLIAAYTFALSYWLYRKQG